MRTRTRRRTITRTRTKMKTSTMTRMGICLRYLVSTTGIMGLSVSCFLPTSNVFIQATTGHDEDDDRMMTLVMLRIGCYLIWPKTSTLISTPKYVHSTNNRSCG